MYHAGRVAARRAAAAVRGALSLVAAPAPARRLHSSPAALLVDSTLSSIMTVPPVGADGKPNYKGAKLVAKTGKWQAVITVDGKKVVLGEFDDAKMASDAYFAAKAVYTDQAKAKRMREKHQKKPAPASGAAADDSAAATDDAAADATAPPTTAAGTAAAADKPSPKGKSKAVTGATAASASALRAAAKRAASGGAGAAASAAGDDSGDDDDDDDGYLALEDMVDPGRVESKRYRGVIQEGPGAELWEVVIAVNGKEVSGGEYETEEEAARAYDALARMYLGPDAPTNFTVDPHSSWLPPNEVALSTGQIEVKPGVKLTVEEVVEALKQEKGVNVTVIDLADKADFADHLVLVTGTSVAHMRKMADTIARAVRKRRLRGLDGQVEARDMDDWMAVDCGNIVVNVFDEEARECFDIEGLYRDMKKGEDPNAGLTYDEWLERNPIPEKWLKRLERDEIEMEAKQRVYAPPTAGRA